MQYFENAKVGDKVWDMRFGYGVITKIDDTALPVCIEFNFDVSASCWFNVSGHWGGSTVPLPNQTLFYAHDKPLVYYPDWESTRKDATKKTAILYDTNYDDRDRPLSCDTYEKRTFHRPKEDEEVTVKLSRKTLELLKEQGIKVVGT